MYRLRDDAFFLGLADLDTPFALWDSDGQVKDLQLDFATGSSPPAVQRAILSIERLDGETYAFGAQDGYLRLCTLQRERLSEVRSGAKYLGNAVTSLLHWRERDRHDRLRSLLFVGTSGVNQGELFTFELSGEGQQLDLRLKFRDLFLNPIVRIFTLALSERKCLCVVDTSGRLTSYDLPSSPDGFLGRRLRHYQLANGIGDAIPIGRDRILVAELLPSRRTTRLRVVRPLSVVEMDVSHETSIAKDSVREFVDGADESVLDVLASFPLGESALRMVLMSARVDERLQRRVDKDPDVVLKELLSEATANQTGGWAELRGLLSAVMKGVALILSIRPREPRGARVATRA